MIKKGFYCWVAGTGKSKPKGFTRYFSVAEYLIGVLCIGWEKYLLHFLEYGNKRYQLTMDSKSHGPAVRAMKIFDTLYGKTVHEIMAISVKRAVTRMCTSSASSFRRNLLS
jgi:hypothetical protein